MPAWLISNIGLRPFWSDIEPKIGAPINWKVEYNVINNPYTHCGAPNFATINGNTGIRILNPSTLTKVNKYAGMYFFFIGAKTKKEPASESFFLLINVCLFLNNYAF